MYSHIKDLVVYTHIYIHISFQMSYTHRHIFLIFFRSLHLKELVLGTHMYISMSSKMSCRPSKKKTYDYVSVLVFILLGLCNMYIYSISPLCECADEV